MPYEYFDRRKLEIKPLAERVSDMSVVDLLSPFTEPPQISASQKRSLEMIAERIKTARKKGVEVIVSYGAHLIKNGLGPVLNWFIENDFVTTLATNGAGTIHDWELAFQGQSTESVRRYVKEGQFGIWDETGRYINLAIALGAAKGEGYGESLGKLIDTEQLEIPNNSDLQNELLVSLNTGEYSVEFGAKAELLRFLREFDLASGVVSVPHPHKDVSVLRKAFAHQVPLCVMPGIGYDIIFSHYLNCGSAIGKTAVQDFLTFAKSQLNLEGGIYISIGSAIMSPMTFEKARAMARNIARQEEKSLDDVMLIINDCQPVGDDWQTEPTKDQPGYYLRFLKTFRRMAGDFHYVEMDNRAFLLNLLYLLK